jgi:hypothetical protein
VIQFRALLCRQRGGLLTFQQIPNALPSRLGRFEFNQFPGAQRGDEFNDFLIRFHAVNVTLAAATGKDYGGDWPMLTPRRYARAGRRSMADVRRWKSSARKASVPAMGES